MVRNNKRKKKINEQKQKREHQSRLRHTGTVPRLSSFNRPYAVSKIFPFRCIVNRRALSVKLFQIEKCSLNRKEIGDDKKSHVSREAFLYNIE